MCRFLRYCVSHCLRATLTRARELSGELGMRSSARWLGYLSRLVLLVALSLGLYARWERTAQAAPLVVLVSTLLFAGAAGVTHFYFSAERLSLRLLHLLFGFLLGLQCLLDGAAARSDEKARAADYLLAASAALGALCALLERLFGCAAYRPAFLTSAEGLELLGFAGAAWLAAEPPSVTVLAAALAALLVALRMKVLLAPANLVCFVVVAAVWIFEPPNISGNPVALACFFARLVCDPLLDFYFSGLSVTERWQPLLARNGPWRKLSLLPHVMLEVTFVIVAALGLRDLDRWYLRIPGFVFFGFSWAVYQMMFVHTAWSFHTKLSECQRLCLSQGSGVSGLNKVMASKGMRLFCLIAEGPVKILMISTIAVAAICWQASSSLFLSILLLVLPLQSLFHGLFHELGGNLGGTSVGYAVVIPTFFCSLDGQPTLLPPGQVQELNERSTGMLSSVQRFFAHHVIETFGCDYSTTGVTRDALRAKIQSLFELRTADGPRYDTYVIFYSGHSHHSGEWALAGGDTLGLDQVLQWWKQTNGCSRSRLIFVLDCNHSSPWVEEAKRAEGLYVAVQAATLSLVTDVERPEPPQLGDFTSRWVEYNCNPNSGIQWSERGRCVSATYGVSRHWSDYALPLPTGSDLGTYWRMHFPRMVGVLAPVSWGRSDGLDVWGLCSLPLRYLRRLKLNWFPPAVLDTGQGFKLVRS
ncbi:transmembrane protein 168-like [Pungitius pungitius]|uniref:transmembrane protein 168-like n=1 Tax=Pungitius pungitius TaxID=134920 RepID=UPI002E0E5733